MDIVQELKLFEIDHEPEGWAMVHSDRFVDLEIAEEGIAELRTQLNAALEREKVLRQGLNDFGKHKSYCAVHLTGKQLAMGGICNCGLERCLTLPHDDTALRQIVEDEVAKRKEPA